VYLVRKVSGVDNGTLYAMKIMKKSTIRRRKKVVQHTMSERRILERIGQVPFLLKLHYAFQTEKNLYLVTGEYICVQTYSSSNIVSSC
jgi:serine/threonine protein kinase